MPKRIATLDTLPKGYKQTITKSGDNTVVIRLTRDYDSKGKRIARTYILGPDGNTLQYAGYFTPNKKDTKSIFETRQNPEKEGRNKAIRNIASKATPSSPSNPIKLDARKPRKASSRPVETPKAEPSTPVSSEPEAPAMEPAGPSMEPEPSTPEPSTPNGGVDFYWREPTEADEEEGYVEPKRIYDNEVWELLEVQEGEWSHEALSDLWFSDPENHNLNKINWLFYGFSDLKARGFLDRQTDVHDSLIKRAQSHFPEILSERDVVAIQEYSRRLTFEEFNRAWENTLNTMGMTNEAVFKYKPDETMNAYETDARFFAMLLLMLRDEAQEKINNMLPDDNFEIWY